MGRKPKADKLTNVERVRRYRERTKTVRLEIIGLPTEIRDQFKQLQGLENAKSSEKLAALIRHWEASPPPMASPQESSPPTPEQPKPQTAAPPPPSGGDEAPNPRLLQRFLQHLFARRKYPTPDRRSAQIQYWRKPYRDHSAFKQALDQLAQVTHPDLVKLVLDNQLALLVADILALQEEPLEQQLKTLTELLEGLSMEETGLFKSKTYRQKRKKWLFQGDGSPH